MGQNVSQREPESEPESARERVCEPEWTRESQRVRQRGPQSELQGPKVSLKVTLGPNLGCQSQPRQPELENIDFPYVFLRFLSEIAILRCVFEGESHQVQ